MSGGMESDQGTFQRPPWPPPPPNPPPPPCPPPPPPPPPRASTGVESVALPRAIAAIAEKAIFRSFEVFRIEDSCRDFRAPDPASNSGPNGPIAKPVIAPSKR